MNGGGEQLSLIVHPKGFARIFLVLSEVVAVSYKATDFYNAGAEMAIH